MADNILTFKDGSVTVAGASYDIFNITLNTGQELLPANTLGSDWERFVGGIKMANGSFQSYLHSGVANSNPFADNSGAMTITYGAGCTFTFNVIIGNKTIQMASPGISIMTVQFAKNDQEDPTSVWAVA